MYISVQKEGAHAEARQGQNLALLGAGSPAIMSCLRASS